MHFGQKVYVSIDFAVLSTFAKCSFCGFSGDVGVGQANVLSAQMINDLEH